MVVPKIELLMNIFQKKVRMTKNIQNDKKLLTTKNKCDILTY